LLTLVAGSDVLLEQQLVLLDQQVGDIYGIDDARVNALSTSFLTFEVLTSGATVSFASGLTYASVPPTSMPEPTSIGLVLLGFLAVAGASKVRTTG
jgi:hypothetical protein